MPAWTTEDRVKAIEMYRQGFSLSEVADQLGRTRRSVTYMVSMARKQGIHAPRCGGRPSGRPKTDWDAVKRALSDSEEAAQ